MTPPSHTDTGQSQTITLFLCGDVTTGRGIDQIHRKQVTRAPEEGSRWLEATLNRKGGPWGTHVTRLPTGGFLLDWPRSTPGRLP